MAVRGCCENCGLEVHDGGDGHCECECHRGVELAMRLRELSMWGWICPECKEWAEDMQPHCFNGHGDDPVATLPFYVDDQKVAIL